MIDAGASIRPGVDTRAGRGSRPGSQGERPEQREAPQPSPVTMPPSNLSEAGDTVDEPAISEDEPLGRRPGLVLADAPIEAVLKGAL